MQLNRCSFCERNFHFKELYDRHVPTCEFFYKSQRERQRDSEAIDALPLPADIFQLVKHVLYEQQELKEKVRKLELQLGRVKKHQLLQHTPAPIVSFTDWVKSFVVTNEQLEHVFQEDLYEGFKKCIENRIKTEKIENIPLRVSPERPNTLYIWSLDSMKWIICDIQEFMYLLDKLGDVFLRVYCHWEDENIRLLESTPENKDKHVNYLMKITGSGLLHKERRRMELRSWICTQLKEPTTFILPEGKRKTL